MVVQFTAYRGVIQVFIDGERRGHLNRMKKGSPKWQANMALISQLTGDPNTETLVDLRLDELKSRIEAHVRDQRP